MVTLKKISLSLLILTPVHIAAQSDKAQPTASIIYKTHSLANKPLLEGKLTPFWAQEYVGSDLARKFVKADLSAQDVTVGIYDGGFHLDSIPPRSPDLHYHGDKTSLEHGTPVLHIIGGDYPIGAAERAQFNVLSPTIAWDRSVFSNQHPIFLLQKEVSKNKPKIINLSRGLQRDPDKLI